LIADRLDQVFIDMDDLLESLLGESIESHFANQGEASFRQAEARVCQFLSAQSSLVIACGGGSLLDQENRAAMEASGQVILLHCGEDELHRRIRSSTARPLLKTHPEKQLTSLLESRTAIYQSFPNRIDTTHATPDQAASHALRIIRGGITTTLGVREPEPGYQVILGWDLLPAPGRYLSPLNLQGPLVIISDTNVAPLYAEKLQQSLDAEMIQFPAGETHKTLETVRYIYDQLLRRRMKRRGTLLALGGGVVGDTAGFVAATFMRGVRWLNFPTSLLAIVDASIGGKVGVHLPAGKNLVGAYHQPNLVLADLGTLRTLPEQEFTAGLAEAIKAALIADPLLLRWFEQGLSEPTQRWLERAVSIKTEIVQQDPFESRAREVLNLGHTVAHGLEVACGYSMRHGEALAIGLVTEASIAEKLGLADPGLSTRMKSILGRWGLPTSYAGMSAKEVRAGMEHDKKRRSGGLRFALPLRPGEVHLADDVPEEMIMDALQEQRRPA
jgi:3-dehydroquinate synthase